MFFDIHMHIIVFFIFIMKLFKHEKQFDKKHVYQIRLKQCFRLYFYL